MPQRLGLSPKLIEWLDEADAVPEGKRAARQEYDYKVRELGYRTDPMNVLPQKVLGMQEFNRQ